MASPMIRTQVGRSSGSAKVSRPVAQATAPWRPKARGSGQGGIELEFNLERLRLRIEEEVEDPLFLFFLFNRASRGLIEVTDLLN